MQFIIMGTDGTDSDALQRRMNAREAHLKNTEDHMDFMLMAAAMLNEDTDTMNGSVMIVDFPTREALDEWLANEPYVQQNVWKEVQVIPCKVANSFTKAARV